MTTSHPFPEKVAIVTGAANGIGKAIAARLSEKGGWKIVAADLEKSESSLRLFPYQIDLIDEQAVVTLVRDTIRDFGRIDAIVSNAGISEFKSLQESTLADWNRVLAVNLTPAFLFAREAEASLRESKGAMVLIASTRAHMSEPDTHAYSATKGALVALSHSLAISLGPDVRVNCISPGWIHTGGESLTEKEHAQHPAGRVGTPEDIAAAVEFLIGDDAGFITGAEWIIDGGMTRKMIYQ